MVLIDLTRQRFGKLVVTGSYHKKNKSGMDEIFWTCKCDCGGMKDVRGFSLRSGETVSCGCVRLASVRAPRKLSVVGSTFGRLTVEGSIRRQVGKRSRLQYICRCACGNVDTTVVDRSKLVAGYTKSCGCINSERVYLPRDIAALHEALGRYRKGARDRNLRWEISDGRAEILFRSRCHYCGRLPIKKSTLRGIKARTDHALGGIDRIDSSGHYTVDNTVACCAQCNYAKKHYSEKDFLEMCRLVTAKHPAPEQSAGISAGLI